MLRRFTLMRVQVDERPRIESTSTSSAAKNFTTFRCLRFHLSNPASAASLFGEFAITSSGIRTRGDFFVAERERVFCVADAGFCVEDAEVAFFVAAREAASFATERARDGATRVASPAIF
jgi:hypothetical protein